MLIISQIYVNDNIFVSSDIEILTECVSFYWKISTHQKISHDLYDTSTLFRKENDTVLQNDEREAFEGLLTEKKCLEAFAERSCSDSQNAFMKDE